MSHNPNVIDLLALLRNPQGNFGPNFDINPNISSLSLPRNPQGIFDFHLNALPATRNRLHVPLQCVFDQSPFAEGRFRKAYKGKWTAPPSLAGKEIVVKKCKENYTWKESDWNTTKMIYSKAQELANAFNRDMRPNYPIKFTDFQICQVTSPSTESGPQQYECVAVEEFIPGDFTKWCNNYGYISPQARSTNLTMPAFMHHSWCHTKGQVMVADLQGVRDHDCYRLTDPAILSITGDYGPTNMGIEGMAMFFLNHECNDICKRLRRPSLHHFQSKISPGLLSQCKTLQQQVANATSYTWEMKFPPQLKMTVTDIFTKIGRGEMV